MTLDNTDWTLLGNLLSVGPQDGIDGTTLTIRNGSRLTGTNAELRLERGPPFAAVTVTGTNSLLRMKTIYVAGSSGNLLSANKGATLTISNGATVAASTTMFVYSNGLVRLSNGTVSNATTLGVVGKLEGAGAILGSLEMGNWPGGGLVRPGGTNGIGLLTVGNLFRMVSAGYKSGRLELEVGGTEPGSGYDQIAVTNAVTLALGTVSISTVSGFKPPIGVSTYDLITGSSLSTNGATVSLPPSGDGVQWSISIANLAGGRKALRLTAEARARGTVLLVR